MHPAFIFTQRTRRDPFIKFISVGDPAFEYLLETGSNPDGDTVGSNMAPVIRNTSQLSPEDRKAMSVYLKSLAPVEGPKRPDGKK